MSSNGPAGAPLLTIRDLHAGVDGTEILRGVDLVVRAGEVHAVMGPNGSGKSTFTQALAGRETIQVTRGEVRYRTAGGREIDLLALPAEERAREGIFLAFQYPVEIPGVSNAAFLRAGLNAVRAHRGEPELDAVDFLVLLREQARRLKMDESLVQRSLNEGFSGGEKKRNEILQMSVLQPRLALLDETDSGLDIDALRIVSEGVNALRSPDRAILMVTHYQRLLDHVVPDHVHVLYGGRIVKSGDADLARTLEERGYGWVEKELAAAGQLPPRRTPTAGRTGGR